MRRKRPLCASQKGDHFFASDTHEAAANSHLANYMRRLPFAAERTNAGTMKQLLLLQMALLSGDEGSGEEEKIQSTRPDSN